MSRIPPFVLLPAALLTAFAVFAGLALSEPGDAPGRKYALVVGVKHYIQGEGLGDLKHTEDDADALAAVLTDKCGFRRVVVMTQTKGDAKADLLPLADNIQDNLKSLLEDCKRGDTVLVAFSGHGIQLKVDGRDVAFFCPMDARPSKRKNLVALSDVYKQLDGSIADVKLLLADCCRNDAEGKGAGGDNLAPPAPPKGVAALFSCSKGQRSFESDEFQQGVFTHYVIEGLKGKAVNKKGEVTLAGLADYVQDEVPDRVVDEQKSPQVHQVPNLVGDVSGKLTLMKIEVGTPPDAPPAYKPHEELAVLHFLIVADTNANIGTSVGVDRDNVTAVLGRAFKDKKRLDLKTLAGKAATPDKVLKYYQALKTAIKSNEAVAFYYTGHGATFDGQDTMVMDSGNLTRQDLLNAMRETKAPLLILITDCSTIEIKGTKGTYTAAVASEAADSPVLPGAGADNPVVHNLFLQARGVVDVTSTTLDACMGDDANGGFFTRSMVRWLEARPEQVAALKDDGFVTWPAFFGKVKKATSQVCDDYVKKERAGGRTPAVDHQLPKAFSLGDDGP